MAYCPAKTHFLCRHYSTFNPQNGSLRPTGPSGTPFRCYIHLGSSGSLGPWFASQATSESSSSGSLGSGTSWSRIGPWARLRTTLRSERSACLIHSRSPRNQSAAASANAQTELLCSFSILGCSSCQIAAIAAADAGFWTRAAMCKRPLGPSMSSYCAWMAELTLSESSVNWTALISRFFGREDELTLACPQYSLSQEWWLREFCYYDLSSLTIWHH